MKPASSLLAALAVPLAAAPVVAPAAAQAPTGDLADAQRFLRQVTTMTAQFSQTDRQGRVLTGTLSWKQPGRIRFQYEKGVPLLVVADGRALVLIDYQVRQVQRWPIRNSPLGVLLDPANAGSYARVVPGDPRLIQVEARDPKHPEYGRITLVLARDPAGPAGLTLQGWAALDSQNNRTTVRLTGQRYGGPMSDNTFRWNDPRSSPRRG